MSHIIVIFDCSGSMGEPFQAFKKTRKRKYLQHEIKIEAAKSSLMDWLQKSDFETVTIIPFSSKTERKLTTSLKSQIRVHNFVFKQSAGGGTNLQAAISRAVKTALKDTEDPYIQYLIVTDGLSQTVKQDIKLVQTIPISQGVSGVLIDPTIEGEYHMRQLCVRGSYMSVTGLKEFEVVLSGQGKAYTERIRLSNSVSKLKKKNDGVAEKLNRSEKQIQGHPRLQKELGKVISTSTRKVEEIRESQQAIINKIADQSIDISQITNEINKTEQEQADLEAIVVLLAKYDQLLQQLKIFIFCPRFLAKGHTTTLFVHIYPADGYIKDLNKEIRKLGTARRLYNTVLTIGMNATIKLECQEILFSNEITKKFSAGKNILEFNAKPDDHSKPGFHEATLTIYNKSTGKEYASQTINLELVDFAFSHISRPLLIRGTIVFLGIVSTAMVVCFLTGWIELLVSLPVAILMAIGALMGKAFYSHIYEVKDIVK